MKNTCVYISETNLVGSLTLLPLSPSAGNLNQVYLGTDS